MKPRLTRERHKALASGKAPLYLRLTYGPGVGSGNVAYIATGIYLLESEWDQKNQKVLGREPEHLDAQAALRVWLGDAERVSQQYRKTPGMTVAKYKQLVLGQEHDASVLLTAAESFYHNKARPELQKAPRTLKGIQVRGRVLARYLTQLKALNLPASEVDLAWLRKFERWCVSNQGYAVSWTRKCVGYVQEVIGFAAHEKLLPLNPVAKYQFETPLPASEPTFLPEAEVQRLAAHEPASPYVRQALHAWLFCCYTGLSYVDYYRFAPTDVVQDAAGRSWIRMQRQKTGVAVSIPVLPETQVLLGCYGNAIPKVDDDCLRERMGKLGVALGLSQKPTPALARHTASHRFRNVYGFSAEEAAAILGHSKEVQHSNYSRKREEGLALALDRLGMAAPAPPTLRQQLEAALAATDAPELREKLLALLRALPD